MAEINNLILEDDEDDEEERLREQYRELRSDLNDIKKKIINAKELLKKSRNTTENNLLLNDKVISDDTYNNLKIKNDNLISNINHIISEVSANC